MRALETLIGDNEVVCQQKYYDKNKRSIAQCYVDGLDLGSMMVNLGYAVDYKRYSKGYYKFEEKRARVAKRGLWAGKFEMPWIWRHNKI